MYIVYYFHISIIQKINGDYIFLVDILRFHILTNKMISKWRVVNCYNIM